MEKIKTIYAESIVDITNLLIEESIEGEISFIGDSYIVSEILEPLLMNIDYLSLEIDLDIMNEIDTYCLTIDEDKNIYVQNVGNSTRGFEIVSEGEIFIHDEVSSKYCKQLLHHEFDVTIVSLENYDDFEIDVIPESIEIEYEDNGDKNYFGIDMSEVDPDDAVKILAKIISTVIEDDNI